MGIATISFLIVPVLIVIPLTVNKSETIGYPLTGITLQWYFAIMKPYPWLFSLQNSLFVATCTCLLATLLGTAAAYGVSAFRGKISKALLVFFAAPLVIPSVILAVATYQVLSRFRLLETFTGLIVSHTVVAVPFVVLSVSASLSKFDRTLLRAALNLGATPTSAFLRVVLPLIAPGVLSGAVLAFAASFDETIITVFVAGPSQFTLPRQLFTKLRDQLDPTIIAAAFSMMGFTILLLIIATTIRSRS